jgi:hypothetical protein
VQRFASDPNPTGVKPAAAAADEPTESTLSELSAASDIDDMDL